MAYYYKDDFLDQYLGGGLNTLKMFTDDKATNVATGKEKLWDSIYAILSTRVGERVDLPEFGSKLHSILFEPNTPMFADLADFYIRDALSKWERRIEVAEVVVGEEYDTNTVPIEITYAIAGSNIYDTYVYPFHVNDYGNPEIYQQGTYGVADYGQGV